MSDAHGEGPGKIITDRVDFRNISASTFVCYKNWRLTFVMGRTIMHLWIRQCIAASQLHSKESAMHSCIRRQLTAAGGICLWPHSPFPSSCNLAL